MRARLRWLPALAVLAAGPALALAGARGELRQLPGTAGCIGSGAGCASGTLVKQAGIVLVGADGRHVYAAGGVDSLSSLLTFTRARSGALTQLPGAAGCTTMSPTASTCVHARAMETPAALALSPDGRNLYVAATNSGGVAVFRRNVRSGVLAQLPGTDACVSSLDTGGRCAFAGGLDQASGVAVSRDGRHVYASGEGIAVLSRNAASGALTSVECRGCRPTRGYLGVGIVAVSPDGRNVYLARGGGRYGTLVAFSRDSRTGRLTELPGPGGCIATPAAPGCARAPVLANPLGIGLTADGRSAYVVSDAGIAVLARDPATGALTQRACLTPSGSAGCTKAHGVADPTAIAVGLDGGSVYVASSGDSGGAVSVFARDPTGRLTQLPGDSGCLSTPPRRGCTSARALDGVGGVAVSPDGRTVYASAGGVAAFARSR